MKIQIRQAQKEDSPGMLNLVQELAEYQREPEAVEVSPGHFIESGFGEKPVWWAFVAEADGEIVGFALYFIRFSTWKGQRLYLEDLIVTKSMRGKGIGKMLFDRLIEEGKKRDLKGLNWQVSEWNKSGINFYQKYNAKLDPDWINGSLEW